MKFIMDGELIKKFKQIVLAKRGKIELTPEGEEALKLYIQKYRRLLEGERSRMVGQFSRVIGAVKSNRPRSALRDLKEMESGEN